MKGYLFSVTALLMILLLNEKPGCNESATAVGGSIVPLSKGNYWIYRDSVFTDGALSLVTNDTDKIVSTEDWNGRTVYVFADGKEWFASGDTIFQLGRQRTGAKIASPVMMPVKEESRFNFMYGGDVVIEKTIVNMATCPESKWKASACYKITDNCEGYWIVGAGIGIIREKTSECFSGKNNYTSRTLIEMKVQ
ncbi:MAG: hypothetical protein IPG01_12905 [Chitinophagaceae bacterium]|nr:hypothetical protein [Chitinophagaceae bacterium]